MKTHKKKKRETNNTHRTQKWKKADRRQEQKKESRCGIDENKIKLKIYKNKLINIVIEILIKTLEQIT